MAHTAHLLPVDAARGPRIDGGGGDTWVEALQGRAQAGCKNHLAVVAAFRSAAVAVELRSEVVAGGDLLAAEAVLLDREGGLDRVDPVFAAQAR